MPSSMTGFASVEAVVKPFRLIWELRSVNHRFLEVGVRLPEDLRAMEPDCRTHVNGALARGKVDCVLKVSLAEGHAPEAELRHDVLERVREMQGEVLGRFPDARPLSVGELLRWPGALEEVTYEPASLESSVMQALDNALSSLSSARQREGNRLAEALVQRCEAISDIISNIRPRIGDAEKRYRAKLKERLDRLAVETNPERLEQEIALLTQRLDISEEIDRLEGHVKEVRDILGREEPIGRRLDFLIQELNREANTLGSKAQDADLTRDAVEMKVLIEQMREQAQNLE